MAADSCHIVVSEGLYEVFDRVWLDEAVTVYADDNFASGSVRA